MTDVAMECYCGARIVKVALPKDKWIRAGWGASSWWRADDGSALCYADEEGMSERDREARHEPFQLWDEQPRR